MVSTEVALIFPTVWSFLGYVGNWMAFFVFGFLAIGIVTLEHSFKTMRQNVISGLSRWEYLNGKLVFLGAVAFAATIYYVLCALAIGFTHTASIRWSKVWQYWDLIPRYFLLCWGYMIFAMMLGLLIRRTGISLFVYFGYILFLESVIRFYMLFELELGPNTRFFPMNVLEDLVPAPQTELAIEFLESNGFSMFLRPHEAVIGSLFYLAIFVGISWWRINRSDL